MNDLNEFAYLFPVANFYHEVICPHEFKAIVRDISDLQRAELAKVYEEIVRRNHAARIAEWVHSCNDGETGNEEECRAWEVRRLFVLFDYLGDAGMQPFSSRRAVFREQAREPNWDEVPQEFRYLVDVTRAFQLYCGHADDFRNHASDDDMEIMARAAEQVRLRGGCEKIVDWVIERPEYQVVGSVLMLIELVGFPLC